jgi:hypothetical protein
MKLFPALLMALAFQAQAAPDKTPAKPPAAPPKPAAPSAAATAPVELDAGLKERIEKFFKTLRDGESRDAYDKLFVGCTLVNERPDLIGDLIKSTDAALEKWGKVESASVIRVRSAGGTVKEISCVVNCRKRPVLWKFYAYLGEGRWQILETSPSVEMEAFFEPEKPARR